MTALGLTDELGGLRSAWSSCFWLDVCVSPSILDPYVEPPWHPWVAAPENESSPCRHGRAEPGIAAGGQLTHPRAPYGASLSFAATTRLRLPSDPPSGLKRDAQHTAPVGYSNSLKGAVAEIRTAVEAVAAEHVEGIQRAAARHRRASRHSKTNRPSSSNCTSRVTWTTPSCAARPSESKPRRKPSTSSWDARRSRPPTSTRPSQTRPR
jgi:hypothetical protein